MSIPPNTIETTSDGGDTSDSTGSIDADPNIELGPIAGHWKFDRIESGMVLNEISTEGSAGPAVLAGTSSLVTEGVFDSALVLDGPANTVSIADIQYSDEFSLTFWFHMNANNSEPILRHGDDIALMELRYPDGNGRLYIIDIDGNSHTFQLGDVQVDTWHLFSVQRDSDGLISVFIDGGLRGEILLPGKFEPTGDLRLGGSAAIDDLWINRSTLSIDEHWDLALVPTSVTFSQLSISATADTYLSSKADHINMAFGSSTKLWVKSTFDQVIPTAGLLSYQQTMVLFDLSTFPSQVENAQLFTLRIFLSQSGDAGGFDPDMTVRVTPTATSWSESTRYPSEPVDLPMTLTVPGAPVAASPAQVETYLEFDVTQLVLDAKEDTLSLRIDTAQYLSGGKSFVNFSSREGTHPPQLRASSL